MGEMVIVKHVGGSWDGHEEPYPAHFAHEHFGNESSRNTKGGHDALMQNPKMKFGELPVEQQRKETYRFDTKVENGVLHCRFIGSETQDEYERRWEKIFKDKRES